MIITHPQLVAKLVKPGQDILSSLTPSDCNLLHMTIGVSGEAGELLDAVKKATIYRKPIDMANIIEELGDIEFFLEGIRQELGINRQDTLTANISKLSARYSKLTYSDQDAQLRADKDYENQPQVGASAIPSNSPSKHEAEEAESACAGVREALDKLSQSDTGSGGSLRGKFFHRADDDRLIPL